MSDLNLSVEPRKYHVTIEYCVPCDYSDQALRVAGELVRDYQHVLSELELSMGSKGTFEVEVDGEVIFSKKALGRHADPGEVLRLFKELVGAETQPYPRS